MPDRVPSDLLDLADHLADYYLAPWGACLRAVTPAHLLAASRPRHRAPGDVGRAPRSGGGPRRAGACSRPARSLTEKQQRLLAVLPTGGLPVADACRLAGVGRTVVDALVRKGLRGDLEAGRPAAAPRSSIDRSEYPVIAST